jgi:hypothetical protein
MNCNICLENIKDITYLPCSHGFHDMCINQWFEKSLSCPVCRVVAVFDIETYMEVVDTENIYIHNTTRKMRWGNYTQSNEAILEQLRSPINFLFSMEGSLSLLRNLYGMDSPEVEDEENIEMIDRTDSL